MRPQVLGVVTRKDLAEPNAKLVLGHKASVGLTTVSADHLARSQSLPFIPYGVATLLSDGDLMLSSLVSSACRWPALWLHRQNARSSGSRPAHHSAPSAQKKH